MFGECTVYKVDPALLVDGVDVDKLPKLTEPKLFGISVEEGLKHITHPTSKHKRSNKGFEYVQIMSGIKKQVFDFIKNSPKDYHDLLTFSRENQLQIGEVWSTIELLTNQGIIEYFFDNKKLLYRCKRIKQ